MKSLFNPLKKIRKLKAMESPDSSNPQPFYHGGAPGLAPGDLVRPSSATGARPAVHSASGTVKRKYRDDRVYITPDVKFALFFAARHAAGVVYEVEPIGEVEDDPHWQLVHSAGTGYRATKQCGSARVVDIVTFPTGMFEEARALMVGPTKFTPSPSCDRQKRIARREFEKKQRKMHRRTR